MARDFEDLHSLDELSDDELRGLVRERLAQHNALDIDDLTVNVADGLVILAGRVGTDGERLVAEHIVTDVVGAACRNDIFVDPTRRVAFMREKIEAVRDGLIRAHNKAFPTAGLKYSPASTGINRAIDDLSELMDLSDMADHLATTKPQD